MLGIILLIVIGNSFYKLAKKHNQNNQWLFPIIGIASYYAGSILLGGITVGIIIEFSTSYSVDDFSDTQFTYMVLPFGFATVYLLYYLLKRKWEKEVANVKDEIQDIGKPIEELEENN